MSSTVQTNKNSDKGLKLKAGGIAGWKSLNPLFKTIFQKLNVQYTVEGMEVSETTGGLRMKATGALGEREWHVCYNGQPAYAKFSSGVPYEESTG